MLKDSLWEMLGSKRPDKTIEKPRFNAHYLGVTPEQLKLGNYSDSYLTRYSLHVQDKANYRMIIAMDNVGRFGSIETKEPTLSLGLIGQKEASSDSQLMQFVSNMTQLNQVLKERVDITEWSVKASDFDMEATIKLTDWTNIPRIFSTKDSMVNFVKDVFPRLSFIPDGWYCAYFAGMTMKEMLFCNFPKETWPNQVSDVKTLERIMLPK